LNASIFCLVKLTILEICEVDDSNSIMT